MIETSVRYVSSQTSVNVLRIDASATTSGISTAGSVPKTKRRMISAPRPPISASNSRLEPPPESLASPSASRPVTSTLIPAGSPAAAAARIFRRRSSRRGRRDRAGRPAGRSCAVLGHVHPVAGREVRARERAGARLHYPRHRHAHRRAPAEVAARGVEDDSARRPVAGPERLQRPLARLVCGLARERQGSDTTATRAGRPRSRRRSSARSTRRSPASGSGS